MSNALDVELLATAEAELLSLIVQESDKRIAAEVQLMLAVDSRSSTLLSATAALAFAAFGVAAAQFPLHGLSPLVLGAATLSLFAALAAIHTVIALRPRAVHIAGWSPKFLAADVGRPLPLIRAEIAARNQEKIDENAACNRLIANRVQTAMILLAVAPFVATFVAVIGAVTFGSLERPSHPAKPYPPSSSSPAAPHS